MISEYRDRRERLLYDKGVNGVEIDPTRSVQRLLDHDLAHWYAYRLAAIANHVLLEGRYSEQGLPFPSLLTDEQRREILQVVMHWQSELIRLKLCKRALPLDTSPTNR